MAKDVKIQIIGDASKFKAALADASGASDKFGEKTKKNGEAMAKFGLGALAVAGGIGVGLFKAGEAASNLGESVNAVQVTFGKSADGILKLGENAAKSVGLSNVAFNGLAVQFSAFAETIAGKGGDVVATMKELTGRAGDFASVMNIDVAESARLFQSGLAGETEPLRKFGIDLSAASIQAYAAAHGIGTLGGQLTESEKVTARYGSLMEQTSKAQGDFANTSGSAANATRIAKAEMANAAASLGAIVAPMLAKAASAAATLVSGLQNVNEASGGMVVNLGLMATAGLGAIGAIATISGKLKVMSAAMHDADGNLNAVGRAATKAALAMGVLTVGVVAYSLQQKLNADNAKSFSSGLDEVARGTAGVIDSVPGLIKVMRDMKDVAPEETIAKMAKANVAAVITIRDAAVASDDYRAKLEAVGVTVSVLNKAITDESAAQNTATAAADKATATKDALAKSNTDAAKTAADLAVAEVKAANAALAYQNQVDETASQVQRDVDAIKAKWDELSGKVNADKAWVNLKQQFDDVRQATTAAFEAASTGADDAASKADEARLKTDDLKLAVIDYGQQIAGLPPEKVTQLLAEIDAGNLQAVQDQLTNALENHTFRINAHLDSIVVDGETHAAGSTTVSGVRVVGGAPAPRRYATGGIVRAIPGGVDVTVAEAGRDEAIVPLNANGSIPGGAGGGNVYNLTVNLQPRGLIVAEREVGRYVTDAIIDMVRRGEIPPGWAAA